MKRTSFLIRRSELTDKDKLFLTMMSAHLEKRSAMVPFFPWGVTMDSSLMVTLRDCDPHWSRLNGATDAILDHFVGKKKVFSLNKQQRDDEARRVM